MPGILACMPEGRAYFRLREGARRLKDRFGPGVTIQLTRVVELHRLESMVRRSGAATVVLDVGQWDAGSRQVPVHAAVAWRRARPDIPVVPYLGSEAGAVEIAALLDAGIQRASLVLPEDDAACWEERLSEAISGGMDASFLDVLPADLDPGLGNLVRMLFVRIASDPSLATMAGWMGCRHEALRKRLRRAALPSGQELRMWIRAYRTLRLIERAGVPHEEAACKLGYSGGSHFSDQVFSLVGLRPTALLDSGGSAALLRTFTGRIEELRG